MWKSIYRRHLRNQISLLKKIRTKQTSRISNRTVTLTKVSFSTIMANDQDISKYFEFAKNLTLEAGKLIKNVDDTEKVVETKWIEKDLVTNFDHKIEEFLINALNKEFPDHKFIGEETIGLSILPELTDSPTWLIDPIDGTVNFVHSFSQYCISVGLAICKEIVLGIIYNPVNCELYTAKKGQGAFLNEKPIRVSKVTELKKSLLAFEVGSLRMYKNRDIALGRFLALFEASQAIRNVGSAALSMAYVAKGVIDCFQMDGLQPWDVAAGMIIVSEAGGTLLDSKGGPFNLMKPNTVVASTTQLACEMTKLIVDTDLKTQRKRLRRT
ncbi:inositol monophosphatase 3-like isoform X1 [Vespa mandarinia]|uniref:inositol monophosphatase 3-like isoform X1 n=2 Tax=Vespa mandarinia TaxID=7446 RepID=UPI00160CE8AD|nr:inositol monophosphatase 3-like isoform X1 [Vespa mandarinia]